MKYLTIIFFGFVLMAFSLSASETNSCLPNIQWRQTFALNSTYYSSTVTNSRGGFFIATTVASPERQGDLDVWISCLSAMGAELWRVIYGGSKEEYFEAMRATSDGGVLVLASSQSPADGNKTVDAFGGTDTWLIRLDSDGHELWQRTLGGTNDDYLYSVVDAPAEGFVMAGESYSPASGNKTSPNYGDRDFWIVAIDRDGTILWDRSYGTPDDDNLASLDSLPDGGFVLGGTVWPEGLPQASDWYKRALTEGNDFALLRLDASGDLLWKRTYGGVENDQLFFTKVLPDGFLLGGRAMVPAPSYTRAGPQYQVHVVRTDLAGNELWEHGYGGDRIAGEMDCLSTRDGGFFLASRVAWPYGPPPPEGLGESDLWVSRITGRGETLWQKDFGTEGSDLLGGMLETTDGGLLTLSSFSPWGDYFPVPAITRFNSRGEILWQEEYTAENAGYDQGGIPLRILPLGDGGYAFTEFWADSFNSLPTKSVLVKVAPECDESGRIIEIHRLNEDQLSLTWESKAGQSYQVEYREDLNPEASWQVLPGGRFTAIGSTHTASVNSGGSPHRFYRVIRTN